MNCHDHIDALVDIARGCGMDDDATRAALAHAGTCEACAERLQRERELSGGLRELAAATSAPDAEAMERRLVRVFAALHETDERQAVQGSLRSRHTPWWRLAGAAMLMLSASVTWYVLATRQSAAPPSTPARVSDPPVAAPLAADVVRPVPPAPVFTVAASPPRRPHHPDAPVEEARLFSDFIALPEASGLPDFESGHIVRIEVPVSMLSAYGRAAYGLPADGLDTGSPAAPAAIEAEVLVGQDGIPRAIRLASSISNN